MNLIRRGVRCGVPGDHTSTRLPVLVREAAERKTRTPIPSNASGGGLSAVVKIGKIVLIVLIRADRIRPAWRGARAGRWYTGSMQAILCAILAGLCWGVGEIFTKSAINTREIGPLGTVLLRAAVTLPLALVGFWVAHAVLKTEPQQWWRFDAPHGMPGQRDAGGMQMSTWLKIILGSGVLAGFGGVFFFYLGLSLPGGDISLLRPIAFALAPATAVLLGWWFLGESMTWVKGAAVVLIVVGIALLALESKKATKKAKKRDAEVAVVAIGE